MGRTCSAKKPPSLLGGNSLMLQKKIIITLDIRKYLYMMPIMDIIEIIRREVEKSSESRRQICLATGINETAMHRIMEQNGSCMAETADKLLTYFGYELKKKERRKNGMY